MNDCNQEGKDNIKTCCNTAQRYGRRIGHKGAVLLVVWNMLVYNCTWEVTMVLSQSYQSLVNRQISRMLVASAQILIYPVVGWLADVYTSRYTMIKYSMHIMWLGAVLLSVTFVVKQLMDTGETWSCSYQVFVQTWLFMCTIGQACYQVNVMPFGADQLQDCPNESIASFIYWMMWSITLHNSLSEMSIFMLETFLSEVSGQQKTAILSLIPVTSLSVAVLLEQHLHRWFDIQRVENNPLKTLYLVIRYGAKTKYPHARSAFTYTGQERPCRLDFAKKRYGGPFTTTEVEDVKTFARILLVIFAMFGTFSTESAIQDSINTLVHILTPDNRSGFLENLQYNFFANTNTVVAVLAALFELVLYPIISKWMPSMLKRVGIGMMLQTASLISQTIYIHYVTDHAHTGCTYSEAYLKKDHYWQILYIPVLFYSISELVIFTATFEFICAQSPNRMRGLVVGIFYCRNGINRLINAVLQVTFLNIHSYKPGYKFLFPSCSPWFYYLNLAGSISGTIAFSMAALCYKKRRRQDVSFQQSIVENVYENDIEENRLFHRHV